VLTLQLMFDILEIVTNNKLYMKHVKLTLREALYQKIEEEARTMDLPVATYIKAILINSIKDEV